MIYCWCTEVYSNPGSEAEELCESVLVGIVELPLQVDGRLVVSCCFLDTTLKLGQL
jgi:hypothetical protein